MIKEETRQRKNIILFSLVGIRLIEKLIINEALKWARELVLENWGRVAQ